MRGKGLSLRVEGLEGRALLSGVPGLGALPLASGRPPAGILDGVKIDPAAVSAVMNALGGGAGSEFVTLLQRQVPNLTSLIQDFTSGRRTEFTAPGIAFKIPSWNESYTGPRHDSLNATLASAVATPNNVLQLVAVTRGPFNEAAPSQVVFGIDRGAGASLGPIFASRPGITPDALVTVNVGPYGSGNTATVTDLKTGQTTTIDPSRVNVIGPVVRVSVDLAALPSTGQPTSKYRFAMWTRSQPTGGIEAVGSFVPGSSMVTVGVLKPVTSPRGPRR